jgi:hypothetical protein
VKRLLTLAGVIAVAALITSAGAATSATPKKFNLSTHSGAIKYLKSIGVDPKGVVIQRGARNYAGPSCPGRRWRCTRATRVFQIAAGGGTNQFVCSDASQTATSTVTSNTDPLDCEITQISSTADNSATCVEGESTNPATETCVIVQTNSTGNNIATVSQKIAQNSGATQTASQSSSIDQQNGSAAGSGANTATVTQAINQNTSAAGDQMQTANQTSCVKQHGVEVSDPCFDSFPPVLSSGVDSSDVTQTVNQNGSANKKSSQTQNDDITGHVTQQTTGLATNQNTQSEHQNEVGGNGNQNQFGPLTCCTDQGSNPGDTYNITQTANQNASSGPNANQSDVLIGECSTTGDCMVGQSANENGTSAKNSCTGMFCSVGIACSAGECAPCSPEEEGCFICTECGGPAFATFRFDSRPVAFAARRLLMRLH